MNVKFEITENGSIYGSYNHYGTETLEEYVGESSDKFNGKTLGDFMEHLMSEYNDKLSKDGWIIYKDNLMEIGDYKEMMECLK